MARKFDWEHALDYAVKVRYTVHRKPQPTYFHGDAVRQDSALLVRLSRHGHSPLRTNASTGRDESTRPYIHVLK